MEKTEILVKVQDIFRDVLDNEEIVLFVILQVCRINLAVILCSTAWYM